MKIDGSHAVIESLLKEKVKIIFGYPGGAIMPVYDALYDYKDDIKHILVRHEQAAGHAAEGYARMTGSAGIALATSGPGATNLVTPIMDAMMDSTPIICITGQVAHDLLGSDAFQEADVIGITTPITKWNYQITKATEIPEVFAKAFHIAQTGRPGPVLIDITKNAQTELLSYTYPHQVVIPGYQPTIKPNRKQITLASQIINVAKRPLLLAGHGILIAKAEGELKKFAEKSGIPVAETLLGLSGFPTGHPLYAGMLGMHGNYGVNMLTNKADVVIAIGMRFDDRVTGRLSDYLPHAKIIHIDIDPAELNKNVRIDVPIVADAKLALSMLSAHIVENRHTKWLTEFKKFNEIEYSKVHVKEIYPEIGEINMAEVIYKISEKTGGKAIIVSDVGQHQMITARYYKFVQSNSFITSGGAGTMGFALPAAIGVKAACPKREVIAIIGDGGFQMNIQELSTIAQEKISIKIIILNNNYLGMVRQWQEMFFENRFSFVDLQNPDFVAVAKGFGIQAYKVDKREELDSYLDILLSSHVSQLLDIRVKKESKVFPMIPSGAAVDEMILE